MYMIYMEMKWMSEAMVTGLRVNPNYNRPLALI